MLCLWPQGAALGSLETAMYHLPLRASATIASGVALVSLFGAASPALAKGGHHSSDAPAAAAPAAAALNTPAPAAAALEAAGPAAPALEAAAAPAAPAMEAAGPAGPGGGTPPP